MSEKPGTLTIHYDDAITRKFAIATFLWGVVGMLVGFFIAGELISWKMNGGVPFLTFGRLRPLHTNAVIFAFAGNAIFAGVYYSMQRLLKARMFNDTLSKLHFWGWQLVIVLAAITLPLGYTTSKEYAELEWPIDVLITVVWVIFAINFFGTIFKRREKHIYVAIWFHIATVLAIAMLHIVNSLAVPAGLMKSYSVFAGVQDALVQWWYGHNAVAFFLTTPFLGLMYYFLPKAAERPVFSYRLSIIHFWTLVFIYIWAGPHHLHYTALPQWAQTLGMVFSVMLLGPSWGGMINGLYTLRGAWDRLRTDPILKMWVVAISFYGMSTFEGPLMSIRAVNKLSHYTDWTIGHVHGGALGWVGFTAFAVLYWMIPRLYRTKLYSVKLANWHFWTGTIGIVLYITSMWVAGITQGLMWKAFGPDGLLVYPNFVETVTRLKPMYMTRALGGGLYLTGAIIGVYNFIKTMQQAKAEGADLSDEAAQVPDIEGRNVADESRGHRKLEGKTLVFTVLTLVALAIGSLFEIVPLLTDESNVPAISTVKPYTPLEVVGRDIYIREGCNNCHSQMVRPFRDEVVRYGEYSKVGEFVYDHPFLWGSRRIGPDLHRVGGKYPNSWHYVHMEDPRATSAGSIMPPYPWLLDYEIEYDTVKPRLKALRRVGVPYTPEEIDDGVSAAKAQAGEILDDLRAGTAKNAKADTEILALIAYLQRLGMDIDWRNNARQ